MILYQKATFHWQIVLVSSATVEITGKTGILLLALNHMVPNIQPIDSFLIDFNELMKNMDIFGTCGLPANNKVAATLKHLCIRILNGAPYPNEWPMFLNKFNNTSSLHFYAYVMTEQMVRSKRFYINAFIANKRSAEYDKAVFRAKSQEKSFL